MWVVLDTESSVSSLVHVETVDTEDWVSGTGSERLRDIEGWGGFRDLSKSDGGWDEQNTGGGNDITNSEEIKVGVSVHGDIKNTTGWVNVSELNTIAK